MKRILVVSLLEFTHSQLEKLRAVSSNLDLQQWDAKEFDDLPESVSSRVEVLYGWGRLVEEAHLSEGLLEEQPMPSRGCVLAALHLEPVASPGEAEAAEMARGPEESSSPEAAGG